MFAAEKALIFEYLLWNVCVLINILESSSTDDRDAEVDVW